MTSESPACPACGFLTVPEDFYGTYNIFEVCGWEDDGVQLANPACGDGANRESLIEAQAAALRVHPLDRIEASGFRRDWAWRPLNREEIAFAERERNEQYWKNKAVLEVRDAYWAQDCLTSRWSGPAAPAAQRRSVRRSA
jgi:hypothetical protein